MGSHLQEGSAYVTSDLESTTRRDSLLSFSLLGSQKQQATTTFRNLRIQINYTGRSTTSGSALILGCLYTWVSLYSTELSTCEGSSSIAGLFRGELC